LFPVVGQPLGRFQKNLLARLFPVPNLKREERTMPFSRAANSHCLKELLQSTFDGSEILRPAFPSLSLTIRSKSFRQPL
jgi:hypothetical protein